MSEEKEPIDTYEALASHLPVPKTPLEASINAFCMSVLSYRLLGPPRDEAGLPESEIAAARRQELWEDCEAKFNRFCRLTGCKVHFDFAEIFGGFLSWDEPEEDEDEGACWPHEKDI